MPKKRKSPAVHQSIDVLVGKAEAHLAAGRYRDAIAVYKQLLKRDQRPEWQNALADAYLARARQLADKGMYKEALVLWENMAALCETRAHLDLYIDWLFKAGLYARGASLFTETDEAFRQSPAGQRLVALLAGMLASGQTEIAEALPADIPLLQQLDSITAAMEAYSQGDDARLKEHLRQIPFRSPYRDLRLILQALPLLDADPQAARTALDRIAVDSPLARFAAVVRTVTLEGAELLPALFELDPQEQAFVFTVKGQNPKMVKLLTELQASDDKPVGAKALFKSIISNSELLEPSSAQRCCLALLTGYPDGLAIYERQFGTLSPFERERILALAEERRGNLDRAGHHWNYCLNQLLQRQPRGEEALKAALILRHLAELLVQSYGPDPWNEQVEDYLDKSLELDPEDKETYLKLMEMARQRDDHKAHDRWVEQAVRSFPQDADILMAAALAAYRRGAFKKAAGFAQTLLERDPINTQARNLLISCHLAHARKQATAGKPALAGKELDNAGQFARDTDQQGIVELNQGLLALLTRDESSGMALLEQGYRHLGAGLVAHFRFLVEGGRMGLNSRQLDKYHKRIKSEQEVPITKRDMLCLADLIQRYLSDKVSGIERILEQLRKPLQAAAELDYTEQEMEAICAALRQAEHYRLLQDYAEAALKRWDQRPVFVYYHVFASTKGWEDRMTPTDDIRLQTALDRALEEDDRKTVKLIEDFLGLPSFGPGGMPLPPPEVAEEFRALIEDLMDELGTDSIEEALDFFMQKLQNAGLPGVPPELFPPKGRR